MLTERNGLLLALLLCTAIAAKAETREARPEGQSQATEQVHGKDRENDSDQESRQKNAERPGVKEEKVSPDRPVTFPADI